MNPSSNPAADHDGLAFLAGGGEMGERIRSREWSRTPLGPVVGWPQSLRSALSICLNSNFPIAIYWGDDLVLLYNDVWSPIPGEKHPWALGHPAREVWVEIWDIIAPLFVHVMTTGEATRRRDQLLPMHRHGFTEECYFDYTFSPIRGEGGGVAGVLNVAVETTTRVIGERRLRTLRELAEHAAEAKTVEAACGVAATFAKNPHDLPFALLYLTDDDGRRAALAAAAGLDRGTWASPAAVDLGAPDAPWPFRRVIETNRAVEVAGLPDGGGPLPGGAWPEPAVKAVVLPVAKPGQDRLAGFVVVGISPRLAFNDDYKGFLDLMAGHVATAVANARVYAEERRRIEVLAELDRTKTAFFSNVSHEFRTPLTLMLGPVEDLLTCSRTDLTPAAVSQLEVVNRNGLRLLRLVNSLLDFSRIEAGRVRAAYQPTDLSAFTADLASNFRSACERAGLRLAVDCPPLDEPAFVDREMWEKVVLNLLSNAFKFTFAGEIAVTLRRAGGAAELRVRDTGTGIPAGDAPRLFERFHRVENARGRTHEGSGIGLALVQELVKLHGGSVAADSTVGRGTTFVVTVPLGSAHLPPEQIGDGRAAAAGTGAPPYVEEALRWLPDEGRNESGSELPAIHEPRPIPHPHRERAGSDERPRVLVADDNADMRQYVARLLAAQFRVVAVPDGEAALAAARAQPPDLVLTDVMMPKLTGFGLLKELRADPRTRDVPVVVLSARAGEESRVEGVEAGADDYLVKPFSARELLARVTAQVQMARLRREAGESLRTSEERLRTALTAARMVAWEWTPADGKLKVSENAADVFGLPAGAGLTGIEQGVALLHPDDVPAYRATFQKAIEERGSYLTSYRLVRPDDGRVVRIEEWGQTVFDQPGGGVRLFGVAMDVTDRKNAEDRLRGSEEQLRLAVGAAKLGLWTIDLRTQEMTCSDGCKENYGRQPGGTFTYADLWETVHPDDRDRVREAVRRAIGTRTDYDTEYRTRWPDGSLHSVLVRGRATYAPNGTPLVMTGVSLDISDRRRAEQVSRFVAGVSAALADLTDSASTFHKVAVLSVPTFADWCAVDMVDEDGQPRRVAVMHADPDKIREFAALLAKYPPRAGDPHGILKVIRTGEPELVEEITGAMLASVVHDEYHLRRLKALGLRSHVLVPIRSHGRVLGVLTFITAESGRLYTAADLVVAEDLASRAAVAVENARLYQALQDADRRKDEFLATLAHELRNPLAPIRNAVQVFRLKGADDPDLQRGRDVIDRQVDHLTRLIDDLLDISRIARNKLELRRGRVTLADAVAGAVETSRPLIERMGHDLAVELPPQPVYLDADLVRLSQVFMNLLTNAAKYTPQGGRIRLAARREGDEAVVAVRDTGLGIPAEKLPSLFEMFFQVDGTLEKAQGGLGIGLSLVRRLVEMHGGTVAAHSDGPGTGSEFVIRLPVLDWQPDPTPDPPPSGDGSAGAPPARRILVVDDNVDAADTLAMLLEITGHEVRTAHDGEAGVRAAGEFRPDVVLMDIGMPKLNGYEACRRIREQPWGKRVLLVALTGWGQDDDRRRTDDAGFDAHLVKPVDHAALTTLLQQTGRA